MKKIDKQVDRIISSFDFKKAHQIFKIMNIQWKGGNNQYSVPSVKRMKLIARSLLFNTASLGSMYKERQYFGLMTRVEDEGISLGIYLGDSFLKKGNKNETGNRARSKKIYGESKTNKTRS